MAGPEVRVEGVVLGVVRAFRWGVEAAEGTAASVRAVAARATAARDAVRVAAGMGVVEAVASAGVDTMQAAEALPVRWQRPRSRHRKARRIPPAC